METIRNYCYLCGTKLEKQLDAEEECWKCPGCGLFIFANPKPTVDAVLCNEKGEVLLTVRAAEPNKGKLNLPGGFMNMNETLEQGMARELAEEIGAAPGDYEPLRFVSSRVQVYQGKMEHSQLILSLFAAKVIRTDFVAGDDAAELVWRDPKSLLADEMADKQPELNHILEAVKFLGF